MIPLIWFLFAWLFLMVVFAIGTFLTVMMVVRNGLSTATTYLSTAFFLLVIAVTLIVTGFYLLRVDWSQTLPLVNTLVSPLTL